MSKGLTAALLLLVVAAGAVAGSWESPADDACGGNCPDDAPSGCPLDCHACMCAVGLGAMLASASGPSLPTLTFEALVAEAAAEPPLPSPREIFHVPKPSLG